jgi:hypothetical protein
MENDAVLHVHGGLLGTRTLRICRRLAGKHLRGTAIRHRAAYADAGRATPEQVAEWLVRDAGRYGFSVDGHTAARIVEAASGLRFRPYRVAARRDMRAVICWFSPVGFRRPLENLHTVIGDLIAADIPVTVSEAVMPGAAPLALPDCVQHLRWHTNSVLFLKENLFNLSLSHIDEPKVLQLDGDVRFLSPSWWDRTSEALDTADIVQPFDHCWWLGKEGGVHHHKESIVASFKHGEWPDLRIYHPGFAWAFRREWLDKVGGIYELHAVGGGDTSLAYAIAPEQPNAKTLEHWVRVENLFHETIEFNKWMALVRSTTFTVKYLHRSRLIHLFHGTREKRRYDDRGVFLPSIVNGDYPIHRRPDGLLEWDRQEHSDRLLDYFRSREEDE